MTREEQPQKDLALLALAPQVEEDRFGSTERGKLAPDCREAFGKARRTRPDGSVLRPEDGERERRAGGDGLECLAGKRAAPPKTPREELGRRRSRLPALQ